MPWLLKIIGGEPFILISNEWQMGWVVERNPDVTFLETPALNEHI